MTAVAGGYDVPAGQVIGGAGTVAGSVVFGAGATLSPGARGGGIAGLGDPATAAVLAVPEPAGQPLLAAVLVCLTLARAAPQRRRGLGYRPRSEGFPARPRG